MVAGAGKQRIVRQQHVEAVAHPVGVAEL
jgi:hypothetical protein